MNTKNTALLLKCLFRKHARALAIACLVARTGAPAFGDARAPLMAELDNLGAAKPLDAIGLSIYGYVQGGYFYDATVPKNGHGPTFIGFNSFKK